MKLFQSLTLLCNLAVGKKTCDIAELDLPDNAEKWQCENANDNLVPAGNDCKLKCKNGYSEAICKFLIFTAKILLLINYFKI